MFGALKRGFRSMASLILVRNVVGKLRPKRTLAASRGFLAAARLSCSRSQHWAKSISPSRDSRDHMAGPISVSLALSQTTAEAARPRIRGSYIAWYARLLLGFRCYSLTDIAGITRWVSVDTQYPQVRAVASTAALYRTATRASLSQHYYTGLNQLLTY